MQKSVSIIGGGAVVTVLALAVWAGLVGSATPLTLMLDPTTLHLPSVVSGAALGAALCALRGVPWLELPRRAFRWLLTNEQNLYRAGAAGICLAILIFY
ncbi:MAG: hypothetical protein ACK4MF_10705 [Hyphomicrobiaceae bacterium]